LSFVPDLARSQERLVIALCLRRGDGPSAPLTTLGTTSIEPAIVPETIEPAIVPETIEPAIVPAHIAGARRPATINQFNSSDNFGMDGDSHGDASPALVQSFCTRTTTCELPSGLRCRRPE
jgi:hypothetical protein